MNCEVELDEGFAEFIADRTPKVIVRYRETGTGNEITTSWRAVHSRHVVNAPTQLGYVQAWLEAVAADRFTIDFTRKLRITVAVVDKNAKGTTVAVRGRPLCRAWYGTPEEIAAARVAYELSRR